MTSNNQWETLQMAVDELECDAVLLDEEWQVTYASPSLGQRLGYGDSGMEGRPVTQFVHSDDVDGLREFLAGLEGGQERRQRSFRVRGEDGSVRWLEMTGADLTDSAFESYALHAWDVTEYKTQEDDLEAFARILEQLHGVTNRLYAAGSVDEGLDIVTEAAVEILGFDWCLLSKVDDGLFEVRATSPESPLSVGDNPMAADEGISGQVYQSGEPHITADMTTSDEANPTHGYIRSAVTVPVGSWGIFQALSTSPDAFDDRDRRLAETLVAPLATMIERFEGEQQLRDSKAAQERQRRQIEALHAVATEMKTAVDREEIFEMTIEAVEDILAFDICIIDEVEDDVLVPTAVGSNMSIDDYYEEVPVDSQDNLGSKTYREGETLVVDDLHEAGFAPAQSKFRSAISVPLGDWGIFQAAAEREAAFDNTDRRLVELLTEHTVAAVERLEREQELERQNDQLEEFASIVSHDLRNPLSVAMMHTSHVQETGEKGHLTAVMEALERMEAIIDDVLTLAKQGQTIGDVEWVELGTIVNESWDQVPDENASVTVVDDAAIEADRGRMAQLFENLFRNAVEHGSTSPDSQAHQDAVEHGSTSPDSQARQDAVEHGSTSPRSQAPADAAEHGREGVTVEVGLSDGVLYVEDDGPGIDEELRDRVFEQGYTGSNDGTGFGLAIVRRIADAHGWSVSVTDGNEGGARFEFTGVTARR